MARRSPCQPDAEGYVEAAPVELPKIAPERPYRLDTPVLAIGDGVVRNGGELSAEHEKP